MSSVKPPKNFTISTPYGPDHVTKLSQHEVERELVHQRRITLDGFVRSDGLFDIEAELTDHKTYPCLLYTSPSPRDGLLSRMPSSA